MLFNRNYFLAKFSSSAFKFFKDNNLLPLTVHAVHLTICDYLYKEVQDKSDYEDDQSDGSEDIDGNDETGDDEAAYREGFMLEEDFTDAVLPEMTEEFKSLLSKVRKFFKFFRNLNVIKFAN